MPFRKRRSDNCTSNPAPTWDSHYRYPPPQRCYQPSLRSSVLSSSLATSPSTSTSTSRTSPTPSHHWYRSYQSRSRSPSRMAYNETTHLKTQTQFDNNNPPAYAGNTPLSPPAAVNTRDHDDRYGFPNHPNRTRMSKVWLYIIAIFLPPVPVFLCTGCGCQVLINILLWALCWIPGVIHSFYVISMYGM